MSGIQRESIRRILIANRGEIARRVIRTCHRLGIETVAVYSDVDASAPHVREASFSEAIGGPLSYLSIEAIVAAAKRSGADAVHPGYGFLSENPALPDALTAAGIVFIGPSSSSIRKLGSKTGAKALADTAHAPVAPTLLLEGAPREIQAKKLAEFAARVGYPVIIKAAAGGGGRGMRLVREERACEHELESAAREADIAFGSSEIFVEKYIAPARHIEVQIIGDLHGDVVALGTRDCSLQRSNQKIIEEAPAIGLLPGATEELWAAACRLAKAAGYSNLGTVEFLYTDDGSFYFLEVNTRLQVEHPVTEMVTGLDLVELQIRIARGEPLSSIFTNATPPPQTGHAIEARWCAEEYTGRFVSATGVILDLELPGEDVAGGSVRADMGYEPCSEVSHYYDSLLGKVIAHADSRKQAISVLTRALETSHISGVATNRPLLLHLLSKPEFQTQRHSIQGTSALLPTDAELHRARVQAVVVASALRLFSPQSHWCATSPWMGGVTAGVRDLRYPSSVVVQGHTFRSEAWFSEGGVTVQISGSDNQTHAVTVNDLQAEDHWRRQAVLSIDGGSEIRVTTLADGSTVWVHTPDTSLAVITTFSLGRSSEGPDGTSDGLAMVSAPLPGKIAALHVAKGDSVAEGDLLLVIDSMKMEHPCRAPRAGVVSEVYVSQGSIIQAGARLFLLG